MEELKERVLKGLATTLPEIVSCKNKLVISGEDVKDCLLPGALFHFMQDVHDDHKMCYGTERHLENLEMKLPLVAEQVMIMTTGDIPIRSSSMMTALILMKKLSQTGLFSLTPDVDNMLALYAACICVVDRFVPARWGRVSLRDVLEVVQEIHWPKQGIALWAQLLITVMSWLRWSELGSQDIQVLDFQIPAWCMKLMKVNDDFDRPLIYDCEDATVRSPLQPGAADKLLGELGLLDDVKKTGLKDEEEIEDNEFKRLLMSRQKEMSRKSDAQGAVNLLGKEEKNESDENICKTEGSKCEDERNVMGAKRESIVDKEERKCAIVPKKKVTQKTTTSLKAKSILSPKSEAAKGKVRGRKPSEAASKSLKTPRKLKKEALDAAGRKTPRKVKKEAVAAADETSSSTENKRAGPSKTPKMKKPVALARLDGIQVKEEDKKVPKSSRAARAARRARS